MSDDVVKARVKAVEVVNSSLGSYGRAVAAALASARGDLNRAQAEFQLALVESQRVLRTAQNRVAMAAAALARCRENCGELERELAQARVVEQEAVRRLERNRQAEARFSRAVSELYSSIRTVEAAANDSVPAGRRFVREYAETLTKYLQVST